MPTRKELTKEGRFEFRISQEEEKQLQYVSNSKHVTKADAIRMGIKMLYNLEKTRSED